MRKPNPEALDRAQKHADDHIANVGKVTYEFVLTDDKGRQRSVGEVWLDYLPEDKSTDEEVQAFLRNQVRDVWIDHMADTTKALALTINKVTREVVPFNLKAEVDGVTVMRG